MALVLLELLKKSSLLLSDALKQQLSIRRRFYPPGEIWSRLETFLIVMTGVGGEAKVATKFSTMYKTAPLLCNKESFGPEWKY